MYSSDIQYIDLKYAKSFGIPGYRRHALYSNHEYGLSVGDFNSRVRFGFVIHKPGPYSLDPIRVELKRLIPSNDEYAPWLMEDIDPAIIKKFVDSLSEEEWGFKQALVVEDFCWYFRGFSRSTSTSKLPYVLMCTIAAKFIDNYGDALATMMLGIPKVNTAADAEEVNDLLISVNAFAVEMKSDASWGTATYGREQAEKKCKELKESLAKVESEMNSIYGRIQEYVEFLSEYGIDEKDIEFT